MAGTSFFKELLSRHTKRFREEALLIAPDLFPGLSAGQLVLVAVEDSPAGRAVSRDDIPGALDAGALVLRLTEKSFLDPQSSLKLSLLQNLAETFGFAPYADVLLRPVGDDVAAVDFVEVTFKDQFVSRSHMWRFQRAIYGHCLSVDQNLMILSISARVAELTCRKSADAKLSGKPAGRTGAAGWVSRKSGLITPQTRFVFRCRSSRIIWLIQLSMEMWEYTSSGGIYFDKFMEFAEEVFKRWNQYQATHSLTIIFFTRSFVHQSRMSQSDPPRSRSSFDSEMFRETGSGGRLANDFAPLMDDPYTGRKYADFYKIVTSNECRSDWTTLLREIRKEFQVFPAVMGWKPSRTGDDAMDDVCGRVRAQAGRPLGDLTSQPSTATDGNFLEAINVALNVLDKHYMDRDLRRSGNSIVMLTPGCGVYLVPCKLAEITKQRMMDNGIGMDTISFSKPPIHTVPLFLFREALSREQTGEEGLSMNDLTMVGANYGSSYGSADSYTSKIHYPAAAPKTARAKADAETLPRKEKQRPLKLSDQPYWMNLSYMDAEKINTEYARYMDVASAGSTGATEWNGALDASKSTIHPLPPLPFPRLLHALSVARWESHLLPRRLAYRSPRSSLPSLPSALVAVLYPETTQLKFLAEDELSQAASDDHSAPLSSPHVVSSDDENESNLSNLVQAESQLQLFALSLASRRTEVKQLEPKCIWHRLRDPVMRYPSKVGLRKTSAPPLASDTSLSGIFRGFESNDDASFGDEDNDPRQSQMSVSFPQDALQQNAFQGFQGAEDLFARARQMEERMPGYRSSASLDLYVARHSSGSFPNGDHLSMASESKGSFRPLTRRLSMPAGKVGAVKGQPSPSLSHRLSLDLEQKDEPIQGPPLGKPHGRASDGQTQVHQDELASQRPAAPAFSWHRAFTTFQGLQALLGFGGSSATPPAKPVPSEDGAASEKEAEGNLSPTREASRRHSAPKEIAPAKTGATAGAPVQPSGILMSSTLSSGSGGRMDSPTLSSERRSTLATSLGSRARVSFGSELQVISHSADTSGKSLSSPVERLPVVMKKPVGRTMLDNGKVLKHNDSIVGRQSFTGISSVLSEQGSGKASGGSSLSRRLAEQERTERGRKSDDSMGADSASEKPSPESKRATAVSTGRTGTLSRMQSSSFEAGGHPMSRPHSYTAPASNLAAVATSPASAAVSERSSTATTRLQGERSTPPAGGGGSAWGNASERASATQLSDGELPRDKLADQYLKVLPSFFDAEEELLFKTVQAARSAGRRSRQSKSRKASSKHSNPFVRPRGDAYEKTHNRRRWAHVFPRGNEASGGGQGWGPRALGQKCRGMNWDSLCQPAIMPLTTDYLPNYATLEQSYLFGEYTLQLPDPASKDESLGAHMSALKSREDLLEELVCQRLTADFQLFIDLRSLEDGNKSTDITMHKPKEPPRAVPSPMDRSSRKRPGFGLQRKRSFKSSAAAAPASEAPTQAPAARAEARGKGTPIIQIPGTQTPQSNLEKFLSQHIARLGKNIKMCRVLSMGHRVQLLNYQEGGNVVVQSFAMRASSKQAEQNMEHEYRYALFVNAVGKFLTVQHKFHKYPVPEFGWNQADHLMCGNTTRMDERVKFKRLRLIILPDWFQSPTRATDGFASYFERVREAAPAKPPSLRSSSVSTSGRLEETSAAGDADNHRSKGRETQSFRGRASEDGPGPSPPGLQEDAKQEETDTEPTPSSKEFQRMYVENVRDFLKYLEGRVQDPLNGDDLVDTIRWHDRLGPKGRRSGTFSRLIPLTQESKKHGVAEFVVTVVDSDFYVDKAFCIEFRWIQASSPGVDRLLKALQRKASELSVCVYQSPQYARGDEIHMHPLIAHPYLLVKDKQCREMIVERLLCQSADDVVEARIREYQSAPTSDASRPLSPQFEDWAASVKTQTATWAPRAISEYASMGQWELMRRESSRQELRVSPLRPSVEASLANADMGTVKPGFPPQRAFEKPDDDLAKDILIVRKKGNGLGFIHDGEFKTKWEQVLAEEAPAPAPPQEPSPGTPRQLIPQRDKLPQYVHVSGGAYIRVGPTGFCWIFSRLPSTRLNAEDASDLFGRFKALCGVMNGLVSLIKDEIIGGILDSICSEDELAVPVKEDVPANLASKENPASLIGEAVKDTAFDNGLDRASTSDGSKVGDSGEFAARVEDVDLLDL